LVGGGGSNPNQRERRKEGRKEGLGDYSFSLVIFLLSLIYVAWDYCLIQVPFEM
jgi:hypothetical protein